MNYPRFEIEEFWKVFEFNTPYLLCPSDTESWSVNEIVSLASKEAKQMWDTLSLGYTEAPGHPLLKEEIGKLYERIPLENTLTFAGAEEGIYCTMRALLDPSDHVIVIDPCYQSLKTVPEMIGAQVSKVFLKKENQWKLDIEDIRRAFCSKTKCLILNYPHNPTGALLDEKTLEALISIAREHNAYIFCDEVYRYLELDSSKRMPSIADAYEKGISLNVMTKSFGLAGLRIGWIVSQDKELVEKIGGYKFYTSICNSAPSEILAIIALQAKEKILGRNQKILKENVTCLTHFMERHQDKFSWVPPQAGSVALIELKLPIDIWDFQKRLVEKAGILIMPGDVLGLQGNIFRIGFGRKNFPQILELFEAEL